MTQITINGKEFNLAYNFKTAIAYERMTGKSALELQQFVDGKVESIAALGYCMILSNNDPANVPEFDDMLAQVDTREKMDEFVNIVSEALIAFFKTEHKSDEQKATDADAKNA